MKFQGISIIYYVIIHHMAHLHKRL